MVVADTAWIISPTGEILASGCLGDAARLPVVGRGGQIWVTYFDEAPSRGSDGAWRRVESGEFEFIEGSVVAVDEVRENSGYGRYTAGYTGMTVFDSSLRPVARHPMDGTSIVDVYATHTDGDCFWYVSYPKWVVDSYRPDGQGPPIADPSHKGAPLIASGDRLARFSGSGRHRDSLFVRLPDGGEEVSIVTFPDGSPLRRGAVTTWGPYLHYFDDLDWYMLDVFAT